MSINWYPGHMHKAKKEMQKLLPSVDMVIEILDARIPFSSENPLLAELRGDKPCLKILNKTDLACSAETAHWQDYLEQKKNIKTLALSLQHVAKQQQILALCKKLVPNKGSRENPITCLITGIPNVGKSTLINSLAGRSIAKTGNEPAVTKHQQRIDLDNGLILFDSPGMLWPKVANPNSGYRLAMTGAIKDTAIDYEDIAYFAANFLLKKHQKSTLERYEIEEPPRDETSLLQHIGKKRGCIVNRGEINYHKASNILIHEYRDGLLGKITLETPEIMEQELIETQAAIDEKAAKKTARKKNYRKR